MVLDGLMQRRQPAIDPRRINSKTTDNSRDSDKEFEIEKSRTRKRNQSAHNFEVFLEGEKD